MRRGAYNRFRECMRSRTEFGAACKVGWSGIDETRGLNAGGAGRRLGVRVHGPHGVSKDARIDELEAEVERLKQGGPVRAAAPAATPPAEAAASPPPGAEGTPAAVADAPLVAPETAPKTDERFFGTYALGRGFGLVRNEWGQVNFGIYTYVRYLNQKGLDDEYINGLGQTARIDKRDDLELNKVKLEFRGWLIDPKFQYVLYSWTNNAAQGQGAQVVLGGNLKYAFHEAFMLGGGILSLPTTRSTAGNFPYWLTVDHRTIADEFFRGSYTMGFFALGKVLPGVEYYAMLGNNLSILGVDAGQLDGDFTTFSGALWWMPTTGEFGPRSAFGDYEDHENLATRLGFHFSFSPEDRQSQPGTDDIDNTQIRLSNGTVVFTRGALAPDVGVSSVKYYMSSIDGGLKYRGLALEGEYFLRWLQDFKADGPLPIDSTFDHGLQVMASAMVLPQTVQLYTMYSPIFGEYGDPWEVTAGVNWWLFRRREVRLNLEYIYDHESPIGYTAVPQVVGGTGSIFNANLEMSF
jgi:hypothetical protein